MVQEIIVIALFGSVVGYSTYRIFFQKGAKSSGGCDKCASNQKK